MILSETTLMWSASNKLWGYWALYTMLHNGWHFKLLVHSWQPNLWHTTQVLQSYRTEKYSHLFVYEAHRRMNICWTEAMFKEGQNLFLIQLPEGNIFTKYIYIYYYSTNPLLLWSIYMVRFTVWYICSVFG